MRCSLVIRSYNEEQHIGRLLTGVLRQQVVPPEIILVDSGSTDATLAIASRFPVRIVHISPEEFTFGRSLNRGLAAATEPLAVLASAHVYPEYDDWLTRLLAPFNDPQVALTYGRQRGDHTSRPSERQLLRQWFPDSSNPSQDHPFCNNANAAIRLSVWFDQPYDESLTGLEDLAWAKRALARGYQLAYVAEAVVVHVHHESPARILHRFQREAIAMRQIFPEARFRFRDFARLFVANVTQDLLQAHRSHELARSFRSVITFRLMQFFGTYRGFLVRGDLSPVLKQRFYYPPNGLPRPGDQEREMERPQSRIDYASFDGER